MSKIGLAEALKKLRELPENATSDEIEAAELDVRDAKQRATPEELEKAKAEYPEYSELLDDDKQDGGDGNGGGSSGARPRHKPK